MAETLSQASIDARTQMLTELAADGTFQGYEHHPEEIGWVVAGLARVAARPKVEYVATPDDVVAVAEYVAYKLGFEDFTEAGVHARQYFSHPTPVAS